MRSEPGNGAVLTQSPGAIRLEFSERPELALATIRIASAADTITLAPLTTDSVNAHIIIAPVAVQLAPGSHTVLWRVAARDGHPVRGTVSFVVAAPVAPVATPPASVQTVDADEATDSGSSLAIGGALGTILVRWIAFISIFILIGTVTFERFVLDRKNPGDGNFSLIARTNAATLGLAASAGVILTAALKLARESADMPDAAVSSILFKSTWGASLLAQMLAALGAAAALRAAHGSTDRAARRAWSIALAFAIVVGLTPAFGGHAIGADKAWIAVPADVVHLLAGSAWLGTLAVIVIVGISAALKAPDEIRPGARVANLINAFSPLALMCGGAVAATGLGSSVLRLPRLSALWTTPYGVILVLKLVFVALLFGAGAWNWRRMKPRLTGDNVISPMRSTASLELVLAVIVLGFTAVLVALELP